MDLNSPIRVELGALYATKQALKKHLNMYAISKHFAFTTKSSCKKYLHVVCPGDNCAWAIRAVRLRETEVFQIRRYVFLPIFLFFTSLFSYIHEP